MDITIDETGVVIRRDEVVNADGIPETVIDMVSFKAMGSRVALLGLDTPCLAMEICIAEKTSEEILAGGNPYADVYTQMIHEIRGEPNTLAEARALAISQLPVDLGPDVADIADLKVGINAGQIGDIEQQKVAFLDYLRMAVLDPAAEEEEGPE